MAEKKKPEGRQSGYSPRAHNRIVFGLAREGKTEFEIAQAIGINVVTLWRWKKKHPALCNAILEGKKLVDQRVESALLKRALGYQYDETMKEKDSDGRTKVRVTTREVAPDVTAEKFWLINRKPEEYRERYSHEHTAPGGFNINITKEDKLDDEKKGGEQ